MELVNRCIANETSEDVDGCYLYLTVDQRYIDAGETQRTAGAHFDGMQGIRYQTKLPADYSFVVSNFNPTRFFTQSFDARRLNMKYDNWFKALGRQIDFKQSFVPRPYEIYKMTSYQMHESPVSTEPGLRTFMRLEFSHKKFDRRENTRNPLLPTNWNYQDRPIPSNLT